MHQKPQIFEPAVRNIFRVEHKHLNPRNPTGFRPTSQEKTHKNWIMANKSIEFQWCHGAGWYSTSCVMHLRRSVMMACSACWERFTLIPGYYSVNNTMLWLCVDWLVVCFIAETHTDVEMNGWRVTCERIQTHTAVLSLLDVLYAFIAISTYLSVCLPQVCAGRFRFL